MKENTGDKTINSEADRMLISFYLSTETIESLEDALFYARKSLPVGKRRKLTKSVLYELGLKMIIDDFNQNGEESLLLKHIDKL